MKRFIALALCLIPTIGCTSSNEEAEALARKEREMERIIRDSEKAEAAKQQEIVSDSTESAEPEEPSAPAEPEYQETEYYMFTSLTEKVAVQCEEMEETACGLTFKHCKNSNRYFCQTNVKYFVKTEKTLVQ